MSTVLIPKVNIKCFQIKPFILVVLMPTDVFQTEPFNIDFK